MIWVPWDSCSWVVVSSQPAPAPLAGCHSTLALCRKSNESYYKDNCQSLGLQTQAPTGRWVVHTQVGHRKRERGRKCPQASNKIVEDNPTQPHGSGRDHWPEFSRRSNSLLSDSQNSQTLSRSPGKYLPLFLQTSLSLSTCRSQRAHGGCRTKMRTGYQEVLRDPKQAHSLLGPHHVKWGLDI